MARTASQVFSQPVIPFAIRWQSRVYSLLLLAALLVLVIVFATTVGSVPIPFTTTFQVLLSQLPFVHITPHFLLSNYPVWLLEPSRYLPSLVPQGPWLWSICWPVSAKPCPPPRLS